MRILLFLTTLLSITTPFIAADGTTDSFYTSNSCTQQYRTNLLNTYQTCIKGSTATCNEICIKAYALGMSKTDCASPSDLQDVADVCSKGCPNSPLCDLKSLKCSYPTVAHSCENYYTCMENVKPCGDSGYALGFGYKYCSAYLAKHTSFSAQGRVWGRNVRVCLQEAMRGQNFATMTCDAISNFAIGSHYNCYLGKPSFCDLSFFDKVVVATTASSALLSKRALSITTQGLQIFGACVGAAFSDVTGKAIPEVLPIRITLDITSTAFDVLIPDDETLNTAITSFITRLETSLTVSYPSLPLNHTLLFSGINSNSLNTTIDIMLNINTQQNITINPYDIVTLIQNQLNNKVVATPLNIKLLQVQNMEETRTTTTTPAPTTSRSNDANIINTTSTIFVVSIIALVRSMF